MTRDSPVELLLLGLDVSGSNERKIVSGDRVAAALAVGCGHVAKYDANEDHVAVLDSPGGRYSFFVVADAHFGRESGEAATTAAFEAFQLWAANPPQGDWPKVLQELYVNRVVAAVARLPAKSASATSFLIGLVDHEARVVIHGSVGDSDLVVLIGNEGQALNPRSAFHRTTWLCSGADCEQTLGVVISPLPSAACFVLVATDGLRETIYGEPTLSAFDLAGATATLTSARAVAVTLLDEALRRDREFEGTLTRGGEDNVALAVIQVSARLGAVCV